MSRGSQTWRVKRSGDGPASKTTDNAPTNEAADKTTVMIGHLPNSVDARELLRLLDGNGFRCKYDFVYLPIDFHSKRNMGHAFVNFFSPADASACIQRFDGFGDWTSESRRASKTTYAVVQGYDANIKRQSKSSITAHDLPQQYKPILFDRNGERIPLEDALAASPDTPRWDSKWSWRGWWQRWDDSWDSAGSGSSAWTSWYEFPESERVLDSYQADEYKHIASASSPGRAADKVRNQNKELEPHGHTYIQQGLAAAAAYIEEPREAPPALQLSSALEVPPLAGHTVEAATGFGGVLFGAGQLGVGRRYACPGCSEIFAKWSACQNHIFLSHQCRSIVTDAGQLPDPEKLQEQCRKKALVAACQ